jgi:hypothetical protein
MRSKAIEALKQDRAHITLILSSRLNVMSNFFTSLALVHTAV